MGSWYVGGPSAEAVTNKTRTSEEALERRTRRTHCRRPRDNPGVTRCCLPRSPFGFVCAEHSWTERPHAGHQLRRTNTVFWVRAAKGLVAGTVTCFSSIGARCVRSSSFVKGGPPKTGVGKGFGPVPEYYMTMGLANPSQRLGWSRTAGFSHMRVSGRYQGHLGPLKRMSPRCLPQ